MEKDEKRQQHLKGWKVANRPTPYHTSGRTCEPKSEKDGGRKSTNQIAFKQRSGKLLITRHDEEMALTFLLIRMNGQSNVHRGSFTSGQESNLVTSGSIIKKYKKPFGPKHIIVLGPEEMTWREMVKSLLEKESRKNGWYLVDPASNHMLVSKTKPCKCKYK